MNVTRFICILVVGIFFVIIMLSNNLQAKTMAEKTLINELKVLPSAVVDKHVREAFQFYGLATYYNNVNYFIVDAHTTNRIENHVKIVLEKGQWLTVVGRLRVMVIKAAGLEIYYDDNKLIFNNPSLLNNPGSIVRFVEKNELISLAPELNQLRYVHLWTPLAWLSKLVERVLVSINTYLVNSWGLTVVVFSVLLKFLMLPVSVIVTRSQRRVSQLQAIIKPRMDEIYAKYDGEISADLQDHLFSAGVKFKW